MGIPSTLNNAAEQIEFLHARVAYLEALLADLFPAMTADIETATSVEIDSSTLSAARKNGLKAEVTKVKDKIKKA